MVLLWSRLCSRLSGASGGHRAELFADAFVLQVGAGICQRVCVCRLPPRVSTTQRLRVLSRPGKMSFSTHGSSNYGKKLWEEKKQNDVVVAFILKNFKTERF